MENKAIWVVGVIAVAALVLSAYQVGVGSNDQPQPIVISADGGALAGDGDALFGGSTRFPNSDLSAKTITASEGLTVTTGDFTVSAGEISSTESATNTLALMSSSATGAGACIQFNATSSATVLKLQFLASSTLQTSIGIAPIITYGTCP